MRKRFVLALVGCLLAAAGAALAQGRAPFVVKDIRVEGVQRIEPGTVFSYLPVKVGDTMTEERGQQALRALFATGFFKDVRLEVENDVLVVLVDERPAVAQIDFSGLTEFQPEALTSSTRGVNRFRWRRASSRAAASTSSRVSVSVPWPATRPPSRIRMTSRSIR